MKQENEDGFTLIEVLISFAILSGAILLAFETGANSARAIRIAEQKTKAMEILRSEINRFAADAGAAALGRTGITQDVVWQIEVRALEGDGPWPNQSQAFLVKATAKPGDAEIETIVVRRVVP